MYSIEGEHHSNSVVLFRNSQSLLGKLVMSNMSEIPSPRMGNKMSLLQGGLFIWLVVLCFQSDLREYITYSSHEKFFFSLKHDLISYTKFNLKKYLIY